MSMFAQKSLTGGVQGFSDFSTFRHKKTPQVKTLFLISVLESETTLFAKTIGNKNKKHMTEARNEQQ